MQKACSDHYLKFKIEDLNLPSWLLMFLFVFSLFFIAACSDQNKDLPSSTATTVTSDATSTSLAAPVFTPVSPTVTLSTAPLQTLTPTAVPVDFALDTPYLFSVDPIDPNVMYVVMNASGIFRSDNGGNTWRSIRDGLEDNKILSLSIDSGTAGTLYASTDQGIFRSLNYGNSWSFFHDGMLFLDPQDDSHIYLTDGGLFESSNSGSSWYQNTNECANSLGSLAFNPVDSKIIYGFLSGEVSNCKNGLYKSSDGGDHWGWMGFENAGNPLFYLNPNRPSQLFVFTWEEHMLYRSTDGGATWSQSHYHAGGLVVFDPLDPGTVYMTNWNNTLEVSHDSGFTWVSIPSARATPCAIYGYLDRYGQRMVSCGRDGGLVMSKDGGVSWVPQNTVLDSFN